MRALLILAFLAAAARAQTPFCAQLQALTQDPSAAAAHWGISVISLTGTPLCGLNDAQLFRPASNAKLFTTAAALALLGPAHTFTTTVTGKLDPATGIVTGDLTLVGGGDPNLDSNDLPYARNKPVAHPLHDLEDLARQLVAAGVRSVTGDVVGDDTLFPYEPYAQGVSADDLVWGYGAPVSALTLADNQLRLTVSPTTGGHAATVVLDSSEPGYYTVHDEVATGAPKSAGGVQVERTGRSVRVYGSLATGAPADVEEIAIDDPAAYAAMLFRTILAGHGITIRGTARAKHRPLTERLGFNSMLHDPNGQETVTSIASGQGYAASCLESRGAPLLASHVSAPLAEDVNFTLKASQNLHAELMLRALGLNVNCGRGSMVAGVRLVRAFLLHAGLAPTGFYFYDGSGLSTQDLITPRAATTLLAYAATQPWFATWKAALPTGGTDGTLSTRFTTDLKSKVQAKTGTLGESRALSGYLTAASGQTVLFSILVDDHLPHTIADRTLTDKMVQLIAASN